MLGDLAVELITQGYDKQYRDPRLVPGMAATEIDPAFVCPSENSTLAGN